MLLCGVAYRVLTAFIPDANCRVVNSAQRLTERGLEVANQLSSMGFKLEWCAHALMACDFDMDAAVNWILINTEAVLRSHVHSASLHEPTVSSYMLLLVQSRSWRQKISEWLQSWLPWQKSERIALRVVLRSKSCESKLYKHESNR